MIKNIFVNNFQNQSEQLILAALKNGAKYSLELAKEVKVGFPGIYAILDSLESQGLIGSYWDETFRPERGGHRRRYYYLKR